MTTVKPRFRAVIDPDYPRSEVIVAHAAAIEPAVHPNAVASTISQDIDDIEARFDIEGPICWRDPMGTARFEREQRRRAIAERNVGRARR